MGKKKINKKALNTELTNAFLDDLDDFDKFENFAMTHWKGIIAICVVIIIGVAAYASVITIQRNRKNKMITTLVNAKKIDALKAALKEYPNADASIGARLRLAVLFRKDKKYAEAAAQLLKVANNTGIPLYQKYRAKLDIAYLDEMSGKLDKAQEKFSAIAVDSFAPQAMKCEAAYAAGRLSIALKNNAKARKYLQDAVDAGTLATANRDYASNLWQRQAQALLLTIPAVETSQSAPKKNHS